MAAFNLSVVAPDRTVFEDQVNSVILPAVNGYMGIQSNHEPMLVALKPGIINYTDTNNQAHFVSISGGFLEVSGTSVIVLAQDAVRSSEVDLGAAEASLEEARKALRGEPSSMTTTEAMHELEKAYARIKVAKLS